MVAVVQLVSESPTVYTSNDKMFIIVRLWIRDQEYCVAAGAELFAGLLTPKAWRAGSKSGDL